jgi:hypothetical protein
MWLVMRASDARLRQPQFQLQLAAAAEADTGDDSSTPSVVFEPVDDGSSVSSSAIFDFNGIQSNISISISGVAFRGFQVGIVRAQRSTMATQSATLSLESVTVEYMQSIQPSFSVDVAVFQIAATDSHFRNNLASAFSLQPMHAQGSINIVSSSFENNYLRNKRQGAAIMLNAQYSTVGVSISNNTVFTNNTIITVGWMEESLLLAGGALYLSSTNSELHVSLSRCTFSRNSAQQTYTSYSRGGAMYL